MVEESPNRSEPQPEIGVVSTAAVPVDEEAYRSHMEVVLACRQCPTVQSTPVVGVAPGARIILVGQAPGGRERDAGRPFAHTAGRTLFNWFARMGVSEDEFREKVHIVSVIRCFPGRNKSGGDRAPSPLEIKNCLPYLWTEIRMLRPGLIVPVGRLAVSKLIRKVKFDQAVGERYDLELEGHPTTLIPLPHPSGRSTWLNDPANRRRLERALHRIAAHPAWQQTFAPPTNRG
ncbi:MAG TPA: uracil-DNA glycosylase family protein [Acidobacteriota bacterium]